MQQPTEPARRFWQDRRGLTAVEYAMIAGTLLMMIAAAFTNLGERLFLSIAQLLA